MTRQLDITTIAVPNADTAKLDPVTAPNRITGTGRPVAAEDDISVDGPSSYYGSSDDPC